MRVRSVVSTQGQGAGAGVGDQERPVEAHRDQHRGQRGEGGGHHYSREDSDHIHPAQFIRLASVEFMLNTGDSNNASRGDNN